MHPELIPGWPIHSYGLMLVIGFYSAYFLARWRAKREGLNPEIMLNLLVLGAILAIVGARALYVVQHPEEVNDWTDYFAIWKGGLVFYGGLILATGGLIIYLVWKKIPIWKAADAAAPAIMLGLAIGRIGCFLNGCCWGEVAGENFRLAVRFPRQVAVERPREHEVVRGMNKWYVTTLMGGAEDAAAYQRGLEKELKQNPDAWRTAMPDWERWTLGPDGKVEVQKIIGSGAFLQHLVKFPGRITPDDLRSLPVHPTQLYETFGALVVCGILLLWWRIRRAPGEVFGLMCLLQGIVRFTVETFRDDTPPLLWGMTLGQVIAIPIFLIGVAGFVYFRMIRKAAAKSAA